MSRRALSRPVALALEDGLISRKTSFFDYGCGRGGDIRRLHEMGIEVSGWDPAYFPDEERSTADVVNLGYVINVIENLEERAVVLWAAWSLARRVLVVAARLDWEARQVRGNFQGDGIITGQRTFQKFYTQDELREWIEAVLDHRVVAAAPGVFYAFKDPAAQHAFLASRVARRGSRPTPRFGDAQESAHRALLQPLIDFVTEHGRFPFSGELAKLSEIERVFGSVPRAFSCIRRITGSQDWEAIRRRQAEDTLVCLALAAFPGRPRFGELPSNLRNDIRAFFGTYAKACRQADALLYAAGDPAAVNAACHQASVGKHLPDALYVHHSALPELPALLRIYEGCGRQLAGAVEGTTLVKLSRNRPRVSYLVYPDFDHVGHPVLAEAVIADLPRLALYQRDYRRSANPPILHKKELLVSHEHPLRARFARLTQREQRLGLFVHANRIGTRDGWDDVLREQGLKVRGHRVFDA